MSLSVFTLFTVAGSAVWNTLLIVLGAALGTQYEEVSRYSRLLNCTVVVAVAVGIGALLVRRHRRRVRTG